MKRLMKGNDAIVHGALLGGATHFFGYPITPASEIAHSAAFYFTKAGRTFLQAESEIGAINMLLGAGSSGARTMTASSGPGIALMGEGLSYIAGSEIPCVVVDIQRAGPGLGNIWPEQGDYNMIVKGGGNGCYKSIVLAPNSVQEMSDFAYKAFDLADKYRTIVFISADAYIGQMMEPVEFLNEKKEAPQKEWALTEDSTSNDNLVASIYMSPETQQKHNIKLQEKYKEIEENEQDSEEFFTEDAETLIVAYGICSRLALTVARELREKGIKIGLLRPKTLYPFPNKRIGELANNLKQVCAIELSNGQMANDVKLAVNCKAPVKEYNWYGGVVPSVKEVVDCIEKDL